MFQPDHIEYAVSPCTGAALRASKSTRDLILCIDDEVTNLELRKLLLQRAGHNVLACHSGKAGLSAFESMPVGLVLLDYSMPGLNGAQVAKVMRKTKPHVPILMLSGHPVPPHDVDKLVDLYLVKGGDPRNLLESVQRLLTQRKDPNPKPPWYDQEIEGKPDFIPYPTNRVVGIIDDLSNAKAAVRDLQKAGFLTTQIRVLTGKEGARRINARGDQHGVLARILRSTQKVLGDYEIPHATRHEREMLAGHFGIGVTVRDKEDGNKALKILKSHRGHFINFYGLLTMEILKP